MIYLKKVSRVTLVSFDIIKPHALGSTNTTYHKNLQVWIFSNSIFLWKKCVFVKNASFWWFISKNPLTTPILLFMSLNPMPCGAVMRWFFKNSSVEFFFMKCLKIYNAVLTQVSSRGSSRCKMQVNRSKKFSYKA